MKPESVLSDNDYKRVFDSLITNPDREAFLRSCIDEYLPANPRFFVLLELVCRERLSPEWESVNQFSIANPNVPIDELKSVRHKDLESVLRLIVATDQQMRYGAIYDRLTAIVREHLPNYPTGHNWSWLNELEPYLGRCKQWSDLLSMYTDQPEIINAKIDKWLEPLLDTQAEAWEEYKRAALINDQPSKIKEIEDGKIMRQIEPELMRRSFQMADFQLQVYRDFLEGLRPEGYSSEVVEPEVVEPEVVEPEVVEPEVVEPEVEFLKGITHRERALFFYYLKANGYYPLLTENEERAYSEITQKYGGTAGSFRKEYRPIRLLNERISGPNNRERIEKILPWLEKYPDAIQQAENELNKIEEKTAKSGRH